MSIARGRSKQEDRRQETSRGEGEERAFFAERNGKGGDRSRGSETVG